MMPTSLAEMREELIKFGESELNVKSMKKDEVKEKLIYYYNKKTDEDMNFTMENLDDDQITVESGIGLKYASPEWSNYVMGLFQGDELIAGYPKINGLRRVANLLLGDIVESYPEQVIVTGGIGEKSVVVIYRVVIEWNLNFNVGFGNLAGCKQLRKFGGVADCNESSFSFGKHPSATAESKAEGRALRKALCLNVIAAEELMAGEDSELSGIPKGDALITNALKTVITSKCKALNINIDNILNECSINKTLDELTMNEGQQVFEVINKYQQKN